MATISRTNEIVGKRILNVLSGKHIKADRVQYKSYKEKKNNETTSLLNKLELRSIRTESYLKEE